MFSAGIERDQWHEIGKEGQYQQNAIQLILVNVIPINTILMNTISIKCPETPS